MSHIHIFTGKYILVCYFHFWYIIPSPCYTEEFLRCITSIALALVVLIGTRFFENTFPKKNKFKNSLQNQLPFVFFYILSINLYIDKEDINQWCYHLMTYLSLYIENCLFIYYFFLIFRFLEKKLGTHWLNNMKIHLCMALSVLKQQNRKSFYSLKTWVT